VLVGGIINIISIDRFKLIIKLSIMNKKSIIVLLIAAVLAIIAIAYIVNNKTQTKNSVQNKTENEKLNVRLSWLPEAVNAPILLAQEKGYFSEEGLDVTIHNGGLDVNGMQMLLSGTDDIIFAGDDATVILAIGNKAPVKIIGTMLKNPNAFVVNAKSNIKRPKDFEGKKIAINLYNEQAIRVFDDMVRKDGGDPSKVKKVPLDFSMLSFIQGKVDGTHIFISDQLNMIKSKGVEVTLFTGTDYDVNQYGHTIVVKEETLNKRKVVLEKFLKALKKGEDYSLVHKDEAINTVIKANSQYNKESLAGNFQDIEQYNIYVKNFRIDEKIINETIEWLIKEGKLKEEINSQDVYTNELIK
jgi:ABC-type nitrate/sulfonate/bicarbonate transport system substrate-binding protein